MADEQQESVSDSQELLVNDDDGLMEPDHTFGRYRFERSLGSGAMATVLLATDTVLGRKVALKVPLIRPEANDRDIQKRFLREAKAAARLSHPNICQIHDVGVVENSLYISMAYIEGISLMQVIDETEKFEEKEIAHLVRGIASAVAEAHSQGVLHRDLKPGNIMVDRRGEPVVLDFGLASFFTKNEDSLMTLEGHALGTPAYMSPEQATNEQELTPATDIYSLGVIMWELITGERLYSGDTMQILGQIVHGEMIKPSTKRPGVSPDLEAICLKALAKRPSERFRSMDDFVLAVEGWLQLRGVKVLGDSGSGILIESQTDISVPDFEAVLDQTRHEIEVVSRMREQRWMYVIAFLAGIIGLLLYLLWGQMQKLPDSVNANAIDSETSTAPSPDGRFEEGRLDFHLNPPRPEMSIDELFSNYDVNNDERLEPYEFPRHIIRRADTNNDDLLNKDELETAFEQLGPKVLMRPPNGQRPGERPRPNPPPPPRNRY
ncbi:MAG: serine/threonine protein kinase [Planctomycetaceae bacterium]|nr:serine/threonine protein kinase [Planctomycetaceae bacterium]